MDMENLLPDAVGILEGIQSDDNDTVRSAAFSAGDAGLREAIPLLVEKIKSENIGVQEAVEYALRKLRGPEAVDGLLPLLRVDDAPVRNVAMDILREIALDNFESIRAYLHDNDPDIRIFIADILGCCRSYRAAILLGDSLLKDPEVNVRYQAASSLGKLSFPESVPVLCQAMHDEEWVQFSVIDSLSKIGDPAAMNALIQILPHSTPLVSAAVIDAVGNLGDIKVVPMLTSAMENVNGALRHKIVKAIVQILRERSLAMLNPKTRERLRVYMLEALEDNDEDILLPVLRGLGAIGRGEDSGALLRFAANLDPETQAGIYDAAVNAIAAIGYNAAVREALCGEDEGQAAVAMETCKRTAGSGYVDDLKGIFWRLNLDMQRMASFVVAQRGAAEDMPFFASIVEKTRDAELLKNALFFFGNQHGCADAEAIVFAQLDHSYQDVKETALEACINLHSPTLNEHFKERLGDPDPMQRMMAVYALGRYDVPENIAEITNSLKDEDPRVRQVAVEAFLNLGADAEQFLTPLLPCLFDEDKDVRVALVDLLGHIGTQAVVRHLGVALEDGNEWVRIRAIEALGLHRIIEAVPTLSQMLETASPMVSFKIIETLGRMGGNAAFSVLMSLTTHEDPEIQHAAAEALKIIQADEE
ncbi:MAG: HEAT repeat domain-containing protein [Desulfovibrio sp.]|jgi:HEAT repeat protein|nr:HEAT repeat domain-containing protein [Desulfovibrio sp.]